MPNFILAYRGGKMPETPEEGARQMAKWKAWVMGLGAAMVDPGTPLGKSVLVAAGGASPDEAPDPLIGFSIVQADGIDAAIGMAKACPYLAFGKIEVAEMKQMPARGN